MHRSFPLLRQCLSGSLFTSKMESVFLPALGHLPIILTAFPLSKRLCHFKKTGAFLTVVEYQILDT